MGCYRCGRRSIWAWFAGFCRSCFRDFRDSRNKTEDDR